MARTTSYKTYERQQRVMTVEDLFNKGMQHVDIPLDEGYAKSLVNFDITNNGNTLTPRGGLQAIRSVYDTFEEVLAKPSNWTNKDFIIHHTGVMLVATIDDSDAILCRYALVGQVVSTPIGEALDLARSYLLIEHNDIIYTAHNTSTAKIVTPLTNSVGMAHGMEVLKTSNKDGIHTSVDGNTYLPIYNAAASTQRYLGRLRAQFSATGVDWSVAAISPKEIQPTQAINYGYNMLKAQPYTFTNSVSPSGALLLNGVIPKNDSGNIVLTSKVGDYITFHLNYQYPQADVDSSKKYLVQWELKDLGSDVPASTVQQVRKSPVYSPGDSITLRLAPSFKMFALLVKVYYKDAVDAVAYVSDAEDYNKLTPIKALSLASYYLTADNNSSAQNTVPKIFDLTTATGMCTWQQRVVLWGVTGARTTLFVSEPNSPDYFPYPNNVEIFTDSIVRAVPYMGNLLVFTYTGIYLLTLAVDGLSYTTKSIQENLVLTDDDACTIRTVKNMVYFRSGNYYYMIVPHNAAGAGELQLAPVSNPITQLLDNFEKGLNALIDDVYNLEYTLHLKEAAEDVCTISLVDYFNYLDGNKMRNVYKCKLYVVNNPTLTQTQQIIRTLYIDFVLTYDTVLRTWTSYMYQTNEYRMIPYEYNVADSTTFISIVPAAGVPNSIDLVKVSPTEAKDTLRINTSDTVEQKLFPNYQLLNTGHRNIEPQLKKRFREVQFSINNLTKSKLKFYTSFIVDDDVRKDLYTYETMHIDNPTDPNYGLIFVERKMTDPEISYGETEFSEDLDKTWELDFSRFPTITVAKVHIKVSGKGYNGKLKLLSKNEVKYELLTTNWVYRPMYGR